jgi:hypothetical protein
MILFYSASACCILFLRCCKELYSLQLAQLMAEHVLQGELPLVRVGASSAWLEGEANEESIRLALLWQRGQEVISFNLFEGRSNSNLRLH